MNQLRLATPSDAEAILAIYSPYIENTSYTFETVTPTVEEFTDRMAKYLEKWPWLVCEVNGKLAGYAYASRYRERTGYQWCAECSVYIHDDFQQMGIGKKLYTALFLILAKQGYRNVYAVINLPNEKSIVFHESMGFAWFATYENVGYKLGRWKNVGWWRLVLNEFDHELTPPVTFKDLDKSFLTGLIDFT